MKKYIGKNVLACFILMIAGVAVGTTLLVLAFLIPIGEDKAWKSLNIIVEEPSYPALPVIADITGMNLQSFHPGVLDNSSDEIMLFTALDTSRTDQSALYRSMSMYNGYTGQEYSYYWHGYVSVLRPLLCVISYDDLRFLNGLLQMLLTFTLVIKVWQKKGKIYGLIMLTSYILLMPMALMFSLQYTWVFYIGMLAALFLICKGGWAVEKQRYVLIFFVIGMLTSYFDMLTYPLFTWGVPLLWWMMMREPEQAGLEVNSHTIGSGNRSLLSRILRSVPDGGWHRGAGMKRVTEVIVSGISWVLGYGIFWVAKWCLATVVLKRNVMQLAIDEVFLRAGMEDKLSLADRFSAAYTNWKHYEYFVYVLILLAWFLWGTIKAFRKGWNVSHNVYAYLLAAVSSVVWYFVLADHTGAHHFFTYRIYNVSILAFLAIWGEAFGREAPGCRHVQKGKGAMLLAVLLIGAGSVGGTFLAREEIWATNGYVSYHSVLISGNDVLTAGFRPTYPRIKMFGICARPSVQSGMIEITLSDGEKVIQQNYFSLENWGEEAYHSMPVNWKLDRNKEYTMEVRLLDNDSDMEILITDKEELPLNEYVALQLNGAELEGQLITGLIYWYRPLDKAMLLFLLFTWMMILSCTALALYGIYDFIPEKRIAA